MGQAILLLSRTPSFSKSAGNWASFLDRKKTSPKRKRSLQQGKNPLFPQEEKDPYDGKANDELPVPEGEKQEFTLLSLVTHAVSPVMPLRVLGSTRM